MNPKSFPAKEVNAYIEYWQKRLSLGDWEISWCIGDEYSWVVKNECSASIHTNLTGRSATISLSPFNKNWKSSIKHEMLELLLIPLQRLAEKGNNELLVENTKHAIIRRLEKVMK